MLFKSIPEIQAYTAITNAIAFESVKPSIISAQLQFIIPYIGSTLLTDLSTKYAANSLSPHEDALVKKIQQALAPYTIYLYAPISDGNLTEQGFRRAETTTQKSAYQYQGTNYRTQLLADANLHTEAMLQFLEDNLANYSVWTSSDAFKRYRSLFIKTGTAFQECYPTASPWRNYYFFRPAMEDVEQLILSKILGTDFYTALKAREITPAPAYTDIEKLLLYKIRKMVAPAAVAMSLPEATVSLDERGLTVYSASGNATRDDDAKRGAASLKEKDIIIRQAQQKADMWLNEIKTFLDANASPTVFAQYYTWQQTLLAAITNQNQSSTTYQPDCTNAGTYGIL